MDFKSKKIIVVLATYNGSERLNKVLQSYSRQGLLHDQWAIVVVDNASRDNTPSIINEFVATMPLLALQYPKPGKNSSLNFAIDQIGPTNANFIFTDDDAIVGPEFLQNWLTVIAERQDFNLFGGVVKPTFPADASPKIDAFAPFYDVLFAQNDRPDGEIQAEDIVGPNMAVRSSVIARGLRFNENIGPSSDNGAYPMGSETEFCVRVATETGSKSWFTRMTSVDHIVRPEQTMRRNVLERARRHGRGHALRQIMAGERPSLSKKERARFLALSWLRFAPVARYQWNWAWLQGYQSGLASRER